MYHPTGRVLTVLELLQSHGRLSGPELAARLEVDVRTVRRYVMMLQDIGIPIQATTGRHGGYALKRGFKLPPLMFTDGEAMALTLGLLLVRRLGLSTAAITSEGALAKVERVLPEAIREQVQALHATLVVDIGAPEEVVESVVLGLLGLAVRQRRRIQMRYGGGDGPSDRQFDPYAVVGYGGRWYTVGHCYLRAGLRVFRADRILRAELRDETFAPPENFDALAYITGSFAAIPDTWDVEVLLATSPERAQAGMPRSLVTLRPHERGTLLQASIDNLDDMARRLIGLACPFEIVRPPELRATLHRIAAELAEV